jgi:hypothetical protein
MPKTSGFEHMLNFVQEYLDGEMSRLDWDLDFNNYLTRYYPKMKRESRELADCFYFYLSEEGFDQGEDLSDSEHKKLIRRQLREFKAAMRDGML